MSPSRTASRDGDGFVRDLRDTLKVLPSPVATYRGLRERPAVLAPWLVVSAVTVLMTLLTLSITQRASVHVMAEMNDPELAESVALQLDRLKWFAVGLAPLQLLARWLVTAGLFWAMATFVFRGMRFKSALSVAAYAGLPAALGTALDLGVTWFEGPEFTPDLMPVLASASSIAVLFPGLEDPGWLAVALRHVTLFSIWSGGLWTVGLREFGRTSWSHAAMVAGAVWCAFLVGGSAADVVRDSLMQMSALP